MKDLAIVFFGSGIGGCFRYGIGLIFKSRAGEFPYATLSANVLACLIAAFFLHKILPETIENQTSLRLLMITGFCGGFSTFSTFSMETSTMMREGNWQGAVVYSLLSFSTGLAAFLIFARSR
jgi:CrcB protein